MMFTMTSASIVLVEDHAILREGLRALGPNLRVLVLTAHCMDEYIGAALNAGADGYVLKDASRAELLQAIRSVIAGQKYFSKPVEA